MHASPGQPASVSTPGRAPRSRFPVSFLKSTWCAMPRHRFILLFAVPMQTDSRTRVHVCRRLHCSLFGWPMPVKFSTAPLLRCTSPAVGALWTCHECMIQVVSLARRRRQETPVQLQSLAVGAGTRFGEIGLRCGPAWCWGRASGLFGLGPCLGGTGRGLGRAAVPVARRRSNAENVPPASH